MALIFHFRFTLTLSQTTSFRLIQTLRDIADDNSKFEENGRKFSEWVENTVGKGEIARYKQCLLFPKFLAHLSTTCSRELLGW